MTRTNTRDSRPIAPRLALGTRESGFTYLGLLFFVAILGAALVAVAQVWHTEVRRQKEADLLFIGNQFRQAIGGYYERTPGTVKQYPKQFEDLMMDPRFPDTRRYLRKVYVDPMTGKAEWGMVRAPDGGIVGVYSLSDQAPLKVAGFREADAGFTDATSYHGWVFAYVPASQAGTPPNPRGVPGEGQRGSDGSAIPPVSNPPGNAGVGNHP
ncbi:MAG TPA: type II secretion system protein [Burkholderiales bacterium]|nr:type II secretion system protein [Burkholderiales bacterium]